MAGPSTERVLRPRLLAEGCFDLVAAAGPAPEATVFACQHDDPAQGRLWDLRRGQAVGPPIPGHVDGRSGAFGLVADPRGTLRPLVVSADDRGLWVVDARDGAVLGECAPADPARLHADVLCLAEWRGRVVVVTVTDNQATALGQVWDIRTGAVSNQFDVWFRQYGAVAEPELLAGSAIGAGTVVLTTQEERVDDYGWPPFAYDHPYLAVLDLATGEERCRLEGGPPVAVGTVAAGTVAVFHASDDWCLTVARFPGGEVVRSFDVRPDMVSVGCVNGRDRVVSGDYEGALATVWDLARAEPVAVINAPGLRDVAIAADGSMALATAAGLLTVPASALAER